jgi:type 1 glutamine amidotransferase
MYQASGDAADPYIKMLGGEFIAHGQQNVPGKQIVADAKFPGIAALPADFGPTEEWYTMKNFPADLHVILVQDTAGMADANYARPPYPSTWARMQGKGRVFYTSMGHRADVWANPGFQSVLLGGINWATGRVDADVTPNLDKVTPKANQLQSAPAPRGGRRGGPPGGPAGGAPGMPAMPPTVAPAAPATPPAAK